MKPLLLKMQAFGPYVKEQIVDFEKLSSAGIFLIKGPTGSGKTTIFDAMTFALYGGSSGTGEKDKTGRNDLSQWRCNQSPDDVPTVVTFTFSVNGHTYRFERRLTKARKNFNEKLEAGEMDEEGNVIPFFQNTKKDEMNKKAEQLVGLTKEQFRQVVLLPQGQFERFLTASSSEKEDILKKIFNSESWDKYAVHFFDAAKLRKEALEEENNAVKNSLAEDNLDSLEDLADRIDSLQAELQANEDAFIAFDAEGKQTALDADKLLAGDFGALHKLEREETELKAQNSAVERMRRQYEAADRAEELRSLIRDAESSAIKALDREKQLADIDQKLPGAQKAEDQAAAAVKQFTDEGKAEKLQTKLGEFAAKRDTYLKLDVLAAALSKAQEEEKQAAAKAKQAENKEIQAADLAGKAFEFYNVAEDTAKQYRDRYFAGIYGEIASQLREDEKCPVCGSIHHPEPAARTAEGISKTQVDRAEAEKEKARKAWDAAEADRRNAEKSRNAAQQKLAGTAAATASAEANFNNASASRIPGIDSLQAFNKAVQAAEMEKTAAEAKGKELQNYLENAKNTVSSLKAQRETARQELAGAKAAAGTAASALQEALAARGYESVAAVKSALLEQSKRNKLLEEVVSHETRTVENKKKLTEAGEKLAGKTEPDASTFLARQEEIKTQQNNHTKVKTACGEALKRLTEKQRILTAKNKHYQQEIHQAEQDLLFAKALRGDTGMGLQRYVLAIMFGQVLQEANHMLEKVHGGRYRLFRTDDKGTGNKRGLELAVQDSRSPEQGGRSVKMLSGGEKFLVSLALSIGMSTVAQKSGVKIEALFIDEGFGTLDDRSINDAMEILESVRRSNGMIGIISHVALLEANITTQVEVVKDEKGNYIIS
ncbi:MAG: SMC family ATPase [Blautia sp.]|nr:SMC family ATPase [Blautia sp.]